ncbi:iron-sulfur cluster biosynthesis protein [Haloechinothrix sp. LS1_15]|uniref:iron-sulfur cluster biosynthesis protein n=1 Tax=Haloechinothrix sp. LS1_15 TaxID=2652248 RepID=UPI00294576C5|nr:iron-sulfur cluster biosynthesis protein [Haloechinothrix sp. LS1_15]MDV6013752.1 iron-sulfur cluster biosynthesis protein [Haloechinothrix sp. LS1_15]
MLAMTDVAAEAIHALTEGGDQESDGQVDQQGEQGQQQAGLRMAVSQDTEGGAQLSLAVADGPEEGDQVVSSETGARVFLEQQAAQLLDDKVLDVQQDEQGQLNFTISQQQPQ